MPLLGMYVPLGSLAHSSTSSLKAPGDRIWVILFITEVGGGSLCREPILIGIVALHRMSSRRCAQSR